MSEKVCSTDGCENFVTASKRSKCQPCLTKQHLAWRAANIEKAHEYESQYRAKNAEKLRLKEKEPKRKDQQNARRRERRRQDPEFRKRSCQQVANYFAANREELNRQRCERARNRTPEERLREHLKRHYRLTIDDYNAMLVAQDNACALCKREPTGKQGRLSVDHNHTTGAVRQLLCRYCNHLVSIAEEKADLLAEAFAYIARHASRTE